MSLKGFLKAPVLKEGLTHAAASLYAQAYFPGNQCPQQLQRLSDTLVRDLLKATRESPRNDVIKRLLKVLVYNPGLRLLLSGFTCEQVQGHLLPVAVQIVQAWQDLSGDPLPEGMVRLVERQVMVNLFSFLSDEKTAEVGITFAEALGHAHLDLTSLPQWAQETLEGAWKAHAYTRHTDVERGFDQGLLRERSKETQLARIPDLSRSTNILRKTKRSAETDIMLATFLEQGALIYSGADLLIGLLHYHLDPAIHDTVGKAAWAAIHIETHFTTWKSDTRVRSYPATISHAMFQVLKELVEQNDQVGQLVFDYLDRQGLINYPLMRVCGLDSGLLTQANTQLSEKQAEDLLGWELGL